MFYNWTLANEIFTTIDGKDYEFKPSGNPYDLQAIFDNEWVKGAIARGYFVKSDNDSSKQEVIE